MGQIETSRLVLQSGAVQVFRKLAAVILLAIPGGLVLGQNSPDAHGGDETLWVGAELSLFNPDYNCSSNLPFACQHDLRGAGAVANLNLNRRWWAGAEARWLPWNGLSGETESVYLAGPGYTLWRGNELSLSGKFLFGIGHVHTSGPSETDFVYAPGVDLAWHPRPRGTFFAGYQYELWPAFAGTPTVNPSGQVVLHNHGLTPNGFSIGFAYRLF